MLGLFAVPAARSTFALALPPLSVLAAEAAEAAVVAIAICVLALWQARPNFQQK